MGSSDHGVAVVVKGARARVRGTSVGGMGWTWVYTDLEGQPVAKVPSVAAMEPFPSQADAETWLGECWRELLDDGVDAVSLWEGDRRVYEMSLHPPA